MEGIVGPGTVVRKEHRKEHRKNSDVWGSGSLEWSSGV